MKIEVIDGEDAKELLVELRRIGDSLETITQHLENTSWSMTENARHMTDLATRVFEFTKATRNLVG